MGTTAATVATRPSDSGGPWRAELIALVRGASGGLLFGVPLLYTMEVWWTGTHTHPLQAGGLLALLTVPLLALNKTEGFRSSRDVRWADAGADTIESIALGVLVTAFVLVLLRELTPDAPIPVWLGKVLYESVPFCLGVGVARHFLRGGRAPGEGDDDSDDEQATDDPDLADLGATTLGATFIALSIAPTDEVPMIASTMRPAWLLLVIASSLVLSYAIVFVAGFGGQEARHDQRGPLQHPVTETLVCYLVALLISALLLWLFQRGLMPVDDLVTRVVVLGLPAAIGGAAGRLAL